LPSLKFARAISRNEFVELIDEVVDKDARKVNNLMVVKSGYIGCDPLNPGLLRLILKYLNGNDLQNKDVKTKSELLHYVNEESLAKFIAGDIIYPKRSLPSTSMEFSHGGFQYSVYYTNFKYQCQSEDFPLSISQMGGDADEIYIKCYVLNTLNYLTHMQKESAGSLTVTKAVHGVIRKIEWSVMAVAERVYDNPARFYKRKGYGGKEVVPFIRLYYYRGFQMTLWP